MDKAFEMAKELARIALESNIPVQDLIEEYKKVHSLATTQENEPTKTIEDIIPPGADLDNGEIYDIETGVTIGEL